MMNHSRTLIIICVFAVLAHGQLHTPFPLGQAMGTLGAVVSTRGPSAHQPWTPACIGDDSLRYGVAIAGVDYYDEMDTPDERTIVHAGVGAWHRFGLLTVKASFQQFNAMAMYFEQSGFVSIGTRTLPFVSLSIEGQGYRAGLFNSDRPMRTLGQMGASVWFPRKYAGALVQVRNITLKKAVIDGLESEPVLSVGLHTTRNRAGAQGVRVETVFEHRPRVRFCFGEEYWFHPMFGVCAGLATDPFIFALGATFSWSGLSTNAAVANHPVLGWSKGFSVDWAR